MALSASLHTGKLWWTYFHQSGSLPTEFHLKWGAQSGSWPNSHIFNFSTFSATFASLGIISVGTYYAKLATSNGSQEFNETNEVSFVATIGWMRSRK